MGFFNYLTSQLYLFVLSLLLFIHATMAGMLGNNIVYVTPTPLADMATTSASTSPTQAGTSTKPAIKTTLVAPTATTPKKSAPTITPVAATKAPTVTQSPASAPTTVIPTEQLNAQTRPALVNILCTTKAGGSFEPISGSGVIIDTRGVILTNAHVGQFFLITNYGSPGNVQCIVRTGSPATAAYSAELLYLPPPWIQANASQIVSQEAIGTGENDYSFLLITGPAAPTLPYPSSFPALTMSGANSSVNDPVFLAAYPAGLLGGVTIQTNLYASSALSTVQALYTFKNPTNIDLISLAGTVVSQSGSSGGAAISAQSGKLVGLIATETAGTTTSSRLLNAITIAHINRSLASLGKGGIAQLLSSDLTQTAADFQTNIAPDETKTLEAVLSKH